MKYFILAMQTIVCINLTIRDIYVMIYLACQKNGGINMFKKKVLVVLLSTLLLFLVTLLFDGRDKQHNMFTRMVTLADSKADGKIDNDLKVIEVDTNNQVSEEEVKTAEEKTEDNNTSTLTNTVNEVQTEEAKAEVVNEPAVVYEGLTMDELASKIERSFKNELSGKGYLYASYSLEKGVDPYLAAAISLEETGCNWNCSNLVKSCNNVGGMKGSGCGSYGYFNTLDDGIRAFIDNISRNYVAYGLTTADTMNPKYAENPAWAGNVNRYIARIRSN